MITEDLNTYARTITPKCEGHLKQIEGIKNTYLDLLADIDRRNGKKGTLRSTAMKPTEGVLLIAAQLKDLN